MGNGPSERIQKNRSELFTSVNSMKAPEKQQIYLIRHGETAWTLSDQHTGLTDIPLTAQGKQQARRLHERVAPFHFDYILTSPLQRAKETCSLAGFENKAKIDPDLVEWNYGRYEGLTSAEIREQDPTWNIFKDGVPEGESLKEIGARADRVLARVWAFKGNVAIFSHGHFLRVLTARYLNLSPAEGRLFFLKPASISILGYEHDYPVLIALDL